MKLSERTILQKLFISLFSIATMICAFAASYYWFQSSKPPSAEVPVPEASISDSPEQHIMATQVDIYGVRDALMEASLLHAKAANWSAWAAGFGGLAALMSLLSWDETTQCRLGSSRLRYAGMTTSITATCSRKGGVCKCTTLVATRMQANLTSAIRVEWDT